MKLAQWRRENNRTQEWVAAELGVTQPFVSAMERAVEPQTPSPAVMREAYVMSGGLVQPNDFYDIPAWEAERIAAEGDAELARRAA